MLKLPKASFQITQKIWMNGKLVDWNKAAIHVLAHGLHYGSAVFEGIRFYDTGKSPAIFQLAAHTKRLFYSAKAIGMKIPFSEAEVNAAILQVVKVNKVKSGYIRPLAFYDYGKMGLNPVGAPVSLAIACWPWGSYLGGKPISVKTSRFIRIHPKSLVADAKVAGHYVNSILASLDIQKSKADEALFLDYKGNLAEGPGENLFFMKKGILHTPKLGSILAGITRNSVMQIARDLKIPVKEGSYKLRDLATADEAFFSGTAAEIQPIGILDGKKIHDGKTGKVTAQILEIYMDAVAGKVPRYQKWLTKVN
ncbi:MAG: branched-chain amino acid transaminase [Candidatus Gracilibacteria bacterium]|nr:branched-chain amino acid transaminase [Candidatus Gracilibacteria bacterium]MDD5178788.1 branched-chain amino acid transaminase [Candidatus Gracilibacteria bacterium]